MKSNSNASIADASSKQTMKNIVTQLTQETVAVFMSVVVLNVTTHV